jgi:hypothetical protein
MATTNAKTNAAAKRTKTARPAISFEAAKLICPDEQIAAKVSASFALTMPEYEAIQEAHEQLLRKAWLSFDEALNEKATAMHFQRIVGAFVSSAQGAGNFYSDKVTEARNLTSALTNEYRDEDREAPAGFESKADRARQFAAEMAMQAYALLAAAEGAVNAYKEITGEDWKPYVAPNEQSVERRSSAAEMSAFG